MPPDRLDEEPGDPGAHPPRRADRALRDRAPAQGRQPDRYFADGVADARRERPRHRRLQDRARHHRAQTGRRTSCARASAGCRNCGRPFRRRSTPPMPLGRITYYNDAAVALAGRTPTLGSDEWCVTWKLYWPDGTPLPHEEYPMAIALKEGRAIRNAEVIAERPDGTRVPFIPYPTLLRDMHGNVVGAINMLVDISERQPSRNATADAAATNSTTASRTTCRCCSRCSIRRRRKPATSKRRDPRRSQQAHHRDGRGAARALRHDRCDDVSGRRIPRSGMSERATDACRRADQDRTRARIRTSCPMTPPCRSR